MQILIRFIIVAASLVLAFLITMNMNHNPAKARQKWFEDSLKRAVPEYVHVAKVIACDILELSDGSKLRLEKINCSEDLFEKKRPSFAADEQPIDRAANLKNEALQFSRALVEDKKVGVRYSRRPDPAGRRYASIYPLDVRGDPLRSRDHPELGSFYANSKMGIVELNASLIAKGYAIPDLSSDIEDRDDTLRLYSMAYEGRRGVWQYYEAPVIH